MNSKTIVVLGGGVGGLVAANELRRTFLGLTLRPGGRALGIPVDL